MKKKYLFYFFLGLLLVFFVKTIFLKNSVETFENNILTKKILGESLLSSDDEYYSLLAKECESREEGEACCLKSLEIMEAGGNIKVKEDGFCPKGFEKSFLPYHDTGGNCPGSLNWCQLSSNKIVSVSASKDTYVLGEKVEILVSNEMDRVIKIPTNLTIQRQIGDGWEDIGREFCIWDGHYELYEMFSAHRKKTVDWWDQKEKICDYENNITRYKQLLVGRYRIMLKIVDGDIVYSDIFIIKNK